MLIRIKNYGIEEKKSSELSGANTAFLFQNYPNPFNRVTTIRYLVSTINQDFASSTSEIRVCLKIYDLRGRLVTTLVNENKKPGYYTISWDGKDEFDKEVANGVYFYGLEEDNYMECI